MLHTLGKITVATAGTPVNAYAQANANGTNSGGVADQVSGLAVPVIYAILVEAWFDNLGKMWVARAATLNKATGLDLASILAIPAAGAIPSVAFTVGTESARNLLSLSSLWIDADNDGEAVLVSYIRI